MEYKHIAVLTGAGISAESGIPVFRSETGLWEQHRVEDVCTYEGYERNPRLVHDFYNKMRLGLPSKQPNGGHLAITRLQEGLAAQGGTVTIITQNIDDLHEKAGSQHIIHMHGRLRTLWCEACDHRFSFDGESSPDTTCPKCGKKAVRPDIVFFGEMPYDMGEIEEVLRHCDLFISIGTSGVVYPAAGFCHLAKASGATCVEFNLERSQVASRFDYGLYGKASETLPPFVDELLEHGTLLRKLP